MSEPRFIVYGGDALDGPVFRVVSGCPPTLDDFRSYADLGRSFPAYHFFRATGVSFYRTRAAAAGAARRFDLPGTSAASVDLRDPRILWANTGGSEHLTVWAPASILAGLVVECFPLDREGA